MCQAENVQVINCGQNGSDPCKQNLLLDKISKEISMNLLVISINSSDINDLIINNESCKNNNKIYNGPWWEFIYSFSHIYRGVIHELFNFNYLLMSNQEYESKQKTALMNIKSVLIEDFLTKSSKTNSKLVVVFHPMQEELFNDSWVFDKTIKEIEKVDRIVCIDLKKELENKIKTKELSNKYYWKIDRHHNSLGYELWADICLERISKIVPCNKHSLARIVPSNQ